MLGVAMFPITYYTARGADWREDGIDRAQYFDIAERNYGGDVNVRTLSPIDDHAPTELPVGEYRLLDMAAVIRSRHTGINRLTFDIFFTYPPRITKPRCIQTCSQGRALPKYLAFLSPRSSERFSSTHAMQSRYPSTVLISLALLTKGTYLGRSGSRSSRR
jgi:hypothetical protein